MLKASKSKVLLTAKEICNRFARVQHPERERKYIDRSLNHAARLCSATRTANMALQLESVARDDSTLAARDDSSLAAH